MTRPNPNEPPGLLHEDWGLVAYGEAWARQRAYVDARLREERPDTFVTCEHPSVLTLGRGTDPANVKDRTLPIFEVERGGDVTWHGPGQLVGYMIRRLEEGRRDLRAHLRLMENIVIETLAEFGIAGERVEGKTGVWVKHGDARKKVCSLGIAARNWVTYHGFALNLDPDMAEFRRINPCGFDADVMASMRDFGVETTRETWVESAARHARLLVAAASNG